MRLLSRTLFREVAVGATLGIILFTFVLFLQKAGQLFAILVRFSGPPKTIAYLFSLAFPQALTFTIPLGVLVGSLLALSRMSSDGEITAMRASGVPGRSVARPVLLFAGIATIAAACCSLWLTPWAYREQYRLLNVFAAAEMSAEIQPRIFSEEFPKRILYIGDVIPGSTVRWRNVFIADITPPEERPQRAREYGDAPRITLASEAIATPDSVHNRIQLTLVNGSSYEAEKDFTHFSVSSFPNGDQVLEAQKPSEIHASKPSIEMDTLPLYKLAYRESGVEPQRRFEARYELHQRFALPLACLLLALVGIPLGVSSQQGGKSGAFVLTVAMAFLYFTIMIGLNGLARQGAIPVPLAVWTPNLVFTIAGAILMARLEFPGDRDVLGHLRRVAIALLSMLKRDRTGARLPRLPFSGMRLAIVPQLIDAYVLNSFIFYFVVLLVSFVMMIHIFTFFELISDIIRNRIPVAQVFEYLFFLTPELIYDSTPLSVLVAVLITFGVFTKNNEVTAFKACGVSAYRLAVPVLLASTVLSGALFAFDHYYVPDANRRQDALRNVIKGRAPQTYLRPDRKWIYGKGDRIYYYKYFDTSESVMVGVSVFELDTKAFRLTRNIQAEKARWEPALKTWVFQNGWSRDFNNDHEVKFVNFQGQAATFPECDEPPNWCVREVKQYFQVNFRELEAYIRDVQRSGFNTVPLQVQYHKKFSVPLFALIMALISIPFAFVAGARGAMAGVGVSFGIAIAYLSLSKLFEQIGNLNQLPPQVAAWSPDAIFALTGLYFLARLRT
jgi:LPS export ABC transporter permease LptF/LPS export ABC transporter permease LptG